MINLIKIILYFSILIFSNASYAAAQSVAGRSTPPQAAPAPPQQAIQLSSDLFVRNAIAVGQALDAGGAAQIYDGASAVMKRTVSREAFVEAVAATNVRVGRVARREWARVERLQVDNPAAGAAASAVPAGTYVTIFLSARNAQDISHLEQISFRLDEDNQWRLSGVTTQTPGQSRH